ncbi:MAG: hypothetical protein IJ785_03525 [Bacteroidales bacterium]|nr:hypothetical protein [Bacteroidales bacterium]
MKRRWIISLILLAVVVGAGAVVKYWPRTVDDSRCGTFYRRYHSLPGIQATFIQGKSLNDTLRVDLTLLQATTPEGWSRLCDDFQVPDGNGEFQQVLDNPDIILSILNYPVDFRDTIHVAAASRALRCVSIFHITTEEQFDAIVEHHIDQLTQ